MNASSIAALPASFQALLVALAGDLLPRQVFQNFSAVVVGWILARGGHTISKALRALGPGVLAKRHSAFYNLFAVSGWIPDVLGEQLFCLLLPRLPDRVTAIVDDTLCRKTGPHIWGAGMHHDAVASSYGRFGAKARHVAFAFGHNFVVLALWVPFPWNPGRGVAIPVLFRLYRTRKTAPVDQYRKRTELAADLLQELHEWIEYHVPGRKLELLGDSEYACTTVLRSLPEGMTFLGPLPMDAALYERPPARGAKQRGRPSKKGARLPNPKALAADPATPWQTAKVRIYQRTATLQIKTLVCLWYTVTGPRPARVVITRDPSGRLEDRAFFCTDPTMTARCLLERYARRWILEFTFRDAKQILGIEDPQNGWWRRNPDSPRPETKPGPNAKGDRGRRAVERTVPAIFYTYALVHLWYFDSGSPEDDVRRARSLASWYRIKREPSFADMLAALRREILRGRISADPDLKRVATKIEETLGGQLWAA